ncbi:hypothetical protein RvY_10860-2 [Ramazzottius varieornatus]|uniref:THAP-type domain-containing protein n=1 Tax=Ramazzottius varieornatus TaxID=947166 RepID=A0A1D1VE56_RAMVA|nr:hypothetical protein RvY_10860-2 [Ramazzottius varieornatus]
MAKRSSGCVIPGCPTRSLKYDGPKVSAFDCPKGARDTWLKIIPRNGTARLNRIVVCERHFEPDCIRRDSHDMDDDGNIIMVPLKVPKLKPAALPTIFPDNPDFVQPKLPKPPKVVKPPKPLKDPVFSSFPFARRRTGKPAPMITVPREPTPEPPEGELAVESPVDNEAATKELIYQRACCEKCDARLDGPCFEHALPADIIYDKPPVALAYGSLPDTLIISVKELDAADGLPAVTAVEFVSAKETIRPGMLFGPLIAPLVPLEDVEEPPRYVLWSEDREEFQAYDLRDNFVCNWTKFIRPTSDFAQVNVVAYQQKDHIYFFTVKEMPVDTELRVFVKVASNCKVLEDWVSPLLDHLLAHHEQFETGMDGRTSDELEQFEDGDELTDTDKDDVSEGDFEQLEEYEAEGMEKIARLEMLEARKRKSQMLVRNRELRKARQLERNKSGDNPSDNFPLAGDYQETDDEGESEDGMDSLNQDEDMDDFELSDEEDEEDYQHRPKARRDFGHMTRKQRAAARRRMERARYWNGDMTAEEKAAFDAKEDRRSDRQALRRGKLDRTKKIRHERRRTGGDEKMEEVRAEKRVVVSRSKFSDMTKEEKEAHRKEVARRYNAKLREKVLAEGERYKNGHMTPEERAAFEEKQKAVEEKGKKQYAKTTEEDLRAKREAHRLRRQRFCDGEMTPEESAAYWRRRIRHNHMSKLRRARIKAAKLGLKPAGDHGTSQSSIRQSGLRNLEAGS